MSRHIGLLILTLVLAVLVSCAKTRQVTDVQKSGFLGQDYSLLTPGDEDKYEAALRYRNPKANWAKYDKILLDPIVLYRGKKGKEQGISPEDAQRLLNYFYNLVYTTGAKKYQMVDKRGSNTVRTQIAITNLEETWVGLDTVSTVVPQMRVLSEAKGFVTEKPSFVGAIAVEFKATDAQTGELLAAAVDKRVGGKTLGKGWDKWSDATNAMEYWTKLIYYRFCRLRGEPNCVRPDA